MTETVETTGQIVIEEVLDVNWYPIFDSIVRDMGLDPFDSMQLVEVEEDGTLITLDAIDMSLPPRWTWPEDEILSQDFPGMMQTLVARQAAIHNLSMTGAYRMVALSVPYALPAAPEREPETVAEWRAKYRPQTLTDTMASEPLDWQADQTLLGLNDVPSWPDVSFPDFTEDIDVPPEG